MYNLDLLKKLYEELRQKDQERCSKLAVHPAWEMTCIWENVWENIMKILHSLEEHYEKYVTDDEEKIFLATFSLS